MNELDLHGLGYSYAKKVVASWIKKNPPPCKIITGNSLKMEKIVKDSLGAKYKCHYESERNLGALIIMKSERR